MADVAPAAAAAPAAGGDAPPPAKVARAGARRAPSAPPAPPPANVIVQFHAADGTPTGPQLDVPQGVAPPQLEALLHGLLHGGGAGADAAERAPYSFYVDDVELAGELGAHLLAHKVSVESALRLVYRPQALFRVRPAARCSASMPGHSEAVLVAAFSPDGRSLATGSGDRSVRVWDLATQTPARACAPLHAGWVLALAWSPDGALLASADAAGGVRLWAGGPPGAGQGAPLGECRGHKKYVTALAWEPAHAAAPGRRRFASASKDATVRVWDAASRRQLLALGSHTASVTALRWGGAGLIYSAGRDCAVRVWDAASGALARTLRGHGHWVNTMALSTDHALRTGAYDHAGRCPADPDEARQKARERYDAAAGGAPERLATGSDDFTLALWSPATSDAPLARSAGHAGLVNAVAFSPDGRWVASASFDKSVKVWSGLTGAYVATLRGHVGAVYCVAWAADSRLLATGARDSTVKLWALAGGGRLLADLPGHADEVYALDWSPDGERLASGGKDRVVKLWRQ